MHIAFPSRLVSFLAVIFGLVLSLIISGTSARADVNDFSFTTFDADYYLSRTPAHVSHLHVVEHLEAQFPQTDQNHGIERAIPDIYDGHDVNLKVASVTTEAGAGIPFTRSTSNHNLVLRIGDAGAYVHGRQAYVITYDMDNVTAKPTGRDGFFWDINGDGWGQTFGHVTARIHLAPDLIPALTPTGLRCYTGARGSTVSGCNITAAPADSTGQVITASTIRTLNAGETLTTELDFTPDTFAAYTVPPAQLLHWALLIFFFGVLPIGLTLWYTVSRWWRYGRDPKGRGVIIPEYTPPPGLSALSANAILTEGFRPKAITATIIDLAIRGYIKIYEVKKDRLLMPDATTYELELTDKQDKPLPEETTVLDLVFGMAVTPGARVGLDDLKNKLYTQAKAIGKTVDQQVTDAGYFQTNPDKAKWRFTTLGAVLIGVVVFVGVPYVWGIGVCGAIFALMGLIMPARTAKGVETRDYLLGLKQFITIAESDRIKVLQSPHGSLIEKIDVADNQQLVKLYEKLLPYAILFGVEKDWAKQFAQLYQDSPTWYSGVAGFNAGYFAGSIAGFNTASTSSFTPPSSSGGGGSAGGGGGGGGGGGW